MKREEVLLAACITFDPTVDQLRRTVGNLHACSTITAIFDNSESGISRHLVMEVCDQEGVIYLGKGENCGTGAALNTLARLAEERMLQWLLYFDQDSEFDDGYTSALRSCLDLVETESRVVVIGSLIQASEPDAPSRGRRTSRFDIMKYTIASGTIFRVRQARSVGGFDEDLFLDTVDHEFCLRLRALGWVIWRDNERILRHEVGTDSCLIWKRFEVNVSRHPMWRRKLMWRNSLIIFRRYYRRFPLDMLKHLVIRMADTLVSGVVYRDAGYITSALRGVRAGLSGESGLVASKYRGILTEGNRQSPPVAEK